ncbi:autotransporter outer membrane beta-barrel domain-containing protein [Aminobacter anthyllidis]|uniref:autotransporter outer membrane beta-barrel domain-containing protein n=1 Tax=Aminobacter anthyllidis TaxID=1035067 RepID=UPI001FEABFFB|nr:autotransporter domain-containing protein [Aminobacter anthyllidis]
MNRPIVRLAALRSGTALVTLGAVAVVLGTASPARAADQYWDGPSTLPIIIEGGAGTWNAGGTNWTDISGAINGTWAGGTAVFGGAGGGVNVQGHQNFDMLRFTGNGYRLTATASDSLTLAPVGSTATINVGTGVTAEIGMILKGSAALNITGGGTLKLSDWVNTYTGATTIGSGTTLQLVRQGKISASSGVAVDGTFDISTTDAGASIKALSGSGQVVLGERSLFLTAANGTFSGVISGNGGVNIDGTKQVFTGANTYLGSTGVGTGATLQIGDGGTSGSVAGAILNYGTVVFDRSDDVTFAGNITGPGAFEHVGGSKLTLTSVGNSGSGTVLISNGGTLQFGDGSGTWLANAGGTITIEAGSKLISKSSSQFWGGKLAGAGDFFKEGSGRIILTGDSSAFAGSTLVNSGALYVGRLGAGKLAGQLDVDTGGRLGGSGTIIGNVTVKAGSTHAVGDIYEASRPSNVLVHTQTINGNYVNNGILEIEASPTSADRLTVNGTVNIANATLNLSLTPNDPSPAGGWDPLNGPFTIIANDGNDAVTGTFASVGNLNNLLFLNHLISYTGGDGNDVTLALSRNDLSVEEVAQSPNQSAVAGAVDNLPSGNPVRSALLMSTDEDEARDALNQLAGDVHASVSGGTTQTSQFLGEFANDRVRSAFGDVAAPDLPVMGYGEGGLELVAADTDRFVVWGQALGNWGSFDGDGNSGGFEHSSGGLVAGGDTVVGDGWRLGLLGGYSRTSFDTDDGAASGDSDNFHVGVYGGRHFGAVALRAGASYTRHSIDTSRTVSFPGLTETLKASYDAGTAQAFIETGYKLEMGRVAFEPFAGLAYVSTSTDGFTETGGAAALTSTDKSFDSTTTTLGLRAATDFNVGDAKATVRGGLGWRHAFGDVTPASTVAFAGGGDSFTVHGAPIARDALLVEAGLDFAIAPKANLALSYNGQIANGARDHGVKASLGVKF